MRPYLICTHVCRIEVGLCGVEHHTVHAGVGVIFVVLNIFIELAVRGDGEDVSIARVVVKGISIHIVGRFLCCEDENGSGVCIGVGS